MALRRGIVLAVAALAIGGCASGDGSAKEPSLSSFLTPPPAGYHYAAALDKAGEEAFKKKVAADFGAEEVQLRNVYKDTQFVAGVVAVRAKRPVPIESIASKVVTGQSRSAPITIAGKHARLVVALAGRSAGSVAIVDTVGRVVLIVLADRYPTARRIAAGLVR
jgi:hypothetical protein